MTTKSSEIYIENSLHKYQSTLFILVTSFCIKIIKSVLYSQCLNDYAIQFQCLYKIGQFLKRLTLVCQNTDNLTVFNKLLM